MVTTARTSAPWQYRDPAIPFPGLRESCNFSGSGPSHDWNKRRSVSPVSYSGSKLVAHPDDFLFPKPITSSAKGARPNLERFSS